VALATAANRKWWALGALSFSLFMIMLDNTVVTVALRAIQDDLHTSVSQLEWVINAYTLTYAVFLLPAGKVADLVGRRRVFLIGLVVFTFMSLWCALASSGGELIAARACQGVGAALMLPATLSVISAVFPPEERGAAIGIWAGVSGGALAIGPLIGGILVEYVSWQWIFYVNVPTGIVGVIATLAFVPESRDSSAERSLDLLGLVLSGTAIFLLTFALVQANDYGWSSGTIVLSFVGAAVLFAAFCVVEPRRRLPIIDLSLFRNSTFTGANVVGMATFVSLLGVIFFLSLYLQTILGYSAIRTGAAFLASTLAIMIAAPVGGKLADRIGPRLPLSVGMVVWGLSLFCVAAVLEVHTSFWYFLPWLILGGFGFGLVLPPCTAAVLRAVPTDKAGVASGLLQALRQVGGALGVAIMGAIITGATRHVPPQDPRYADRFVHGMHWVLILGGAVAVAGGLLGWVTVRQHAAVDEGEPAASAHAGLL
jgi:EmrB/QacA subfamily drug resistance transporter